MPRTVTIPLYTALDAQTQQRITRSERVKRWIVTALLTIVFAAAFAVYLAGELVSNHLVDESLYTTALSENDVYNRIYTELLADPAFADTTEQLLGSLHITAGSSRDIYSFTVSTLRLILPPERIQAAYEAAVRESTAYLRGDRPELQARLDFSSAFEDPEIQDKIVAAVQAYSANLLAQLQAGISEVHTRLDAEDRRIILTYILQLSEGFVGEPPPNLNLLDPSSMTEAEREQFARDLLSPLDETPPPELLHQIEAALTADDLLGAVMIASANTLDAVVERGLNELRLILAAGGLDVLHELAVLAEESEQIIIDDLNNIRAIMLGIDQGLTPLAILTMVLVLAQLNAIYDERPRLSLRVIGTLLVITALVMLGLWAFVQFQSLLPMVELVNPESTLPASLKSILRDMMATFASRLWQSVILTAAPPLLIGLLFLLASLINLMALRRQMSASTQRLFAPLLDNPQYALFIVGALGIVLPVIGNLRLTGGALDEPEARRCNGHAVLCERPFDQVAFAATHNAMSISRLNWWWPAHDLTLSAQLESGVRALLIDTMYWDDARNAEKYLATLPEEIHPIVREELARTTQLQRDGTYLCHGLCTLGATSLVEALAEIHSFMEAQPNEVLILIIEDGITPEDTAAAFEFSGLTRMTYIHDSADGWPTLGEMIENNQRLVVLVENEAPPPPWYLNAWEHTQETPYNFTSLESMSCALNRGTDDRPLFLLNHWIDRVSPDRVDAARLNQYEFLLNRVRQCQQERGQMPNFIAVNFSSIGHVLEVVDVLNGVQPPRALVEVP